MSGFGFGGGNSNVLDRLYRGEIGNFFFCSKVGNEYRLFRTMVNCNVQNGIGGKLVDFNGNFGNNEITRKTKGEYTNLIMSNVSIIPVYKKNVEVLAMKPTGNGSFEKKFRLAKVVSEQKVCPEGRTSMSLGSSSCRRERHSYDLIFKGEKEKINVFEEMIVPTEEYWGKELSVYEPKSESSSSSESESDTQSSSSSESESKTKHKSKKHHRSVHKHHKRSHKHHGKCPNIIIMPIFMPVPMNQQYLGYGSYF